MLRTLTGLTLTGPNAIRALEAMGLLNAVLGKIPPGSLSSKGFLFYSGVGGQELVYDVRQSRGRAPGPSCEPFRSRHRTQYPPAPEDASISMHR